VHYLTVELLPNAAGKLLGIEFPLLWRMPAYSEKVNLVDIWQSSSFSP